MPIDTGDVRRSVTGPMSDEEYQGIITGMVDDAVDFHDDELSSSREEALNYLRGETDVPQPEPGFSSVVSRVSEDELDGYMTQLMKLFTGAGTPVAFLPSSDNDQELAKQQTDYASYIYSIKNPGYRNTYDTCRSAIGSAAVAGMKVVWSEETEVWQENYTNLGPEEVEEFESDPAAEIVEREDVTEEEQIPVQLEDGTEIRETVTRSYTNLTVKWKKPKNGIVIENIPGEELRFDRRAIDSDSARIIFQDTRRTRSDLIALGMDDDFIDTHGGSGSGSGEATSQQDQEKRARTGFDQDADNDRDGGRAMDTYRLLDIWARVDKDGDGIAEWRHCLAIGDHATVWEPSDEMAHDVQIALFIPFLVENTAVGRSLHTKTKDVADTETCLIRGMVDNLSQSNFPKQVAVGSQIENWPAAITNRRSVVNAKRPGVVEYLSVPYLVDGVLKGLEFFKQMTAGRLGVSDAARGLDPEHLQSSSDFGVRETFSLGASGHEMVARNLAETGFTKVFRLIIKLSARHQTDMEIIRLRGKLVPINPRQFDAGMDMEAKVGIGTGQKEARMTSLLMIKSVQEQAIASDGEDNAICDTQMYVNTLDDILELQDIKDEGRYFKSPPEQPEPTPDPAQAQIEAAQAEAQTKAQADLAKAQLQAQVDLRKAQISAQSDERKAIIDAQAKLVIAQAQLGQTAAIDQAKLELQARKDAIDGALRQQELDRETALELRAQNIEATLDGEKIRQAQLRRPN